MPRKRFTNEQIAFALRQAENGATVDEVCRKMGMSEPTFYRWKKQFVGMGVPEIRRLKQLEDENSKLKRLVADLTLDRSMLQDVLQTKVVRPAVRREVAGHLQVAYEISERRACQATGFGRSSQRYRKRSRSAGGAAHAAEGAGSRTGPLRLPSAAHPVATGGLAVNHKRTYRLYREEGSVDPVQAAQTQTGLALPPGSSGDRRPERGLGDGLHVRPRYSMGAHSGILTVSTATRERRLRSLREPTSAPSRSSRFWTRLVASARQAEEPSGRQRPGVRRADARSMGLPERRRDRLLPAGQADRQRLY